MFLYNGGNDTISDFAVGTDVLVLNPDLLHSSGIATTAVSDMFTITNGNAVLNLGDGNSITLAGLTDTTGLDVYSFFC